MRMRAIPVAAAALLGACALTSCVPTAGAVGQGNITPFGFSVEPATVPPGGEVTLKVDRNDGGCKGPATASSPVFDPVTIPRGQSAAKAVVDWDVKPGGVYQVSFTCDGVSGTTSLTIAGPSGSPTPTPSPSVPVPSHPGHEQPPGSGHHKQPEHPGQPEHPQKGVHAGEGGAFADLDLGKLGLGAALIAGAVGAAYHLSRRRTGEDGA